jgi:hypothetical protein
MKSLKTRAKYYPAPLCISPASGEIQRGALPTAVNIAEAAEADNSDLAPG